MGIFSKGRMSVAPLAPELGNSFGFLSTKAKQRKCVSACTVMGADRSQPHLQAKGLLRSTASSFSSTISFTDNKVEGEVSLIIKVKINLLSKSYLVKLQSFRQFWGKKPKSLQQAVKSLGNGRIFWRRTIIKSLPFMHTKKKKTSLSER